MNILKNLAYNMYLKNIHNLLTNKHLTPIFGVKSGGSSD